MWRMTEDEYNKLVADMQAKSARRLPKSESVVGDVAKAEDEAKEERAEESKGRYRIVVVARRCRAIDPDNVIAKWAIDELVDAGVLPDDSSRWVVAVEKRVEVVRAGEEETVIEIWKEER